MSQHRKRYGLAIAALSILGASTAGCSHNGDAGQSSAAKQSLDRTAAIATQSGGDWDKISQSDQQFLIQTAGYGQEQTARLFIQGLAHHISRANAPVGGGPRRRQ